MKIKKNSFRLIYVSLYCFRGFQEDRVSLGILNAIFASELQNVFEAPVIYKSPSKKSFLCSFFGIVSLWRF